MIFHKKVAFTRTAVMVSASHKIFETTVNWFIPQMSISTGVRMLFFLQSVVVGVTSPVLTYAGTDNNITGPHAFNL